MKKNNAIKNTFILTPLALAIVACGGGGGSDGPSESPTESLSVTALDGYLYNAEVCLDFDYDNICDTDYVTTNENGVATFTLDTIPDSAIAIVRAIAGQTIDQDNPGTTIFESYSMRGLPGGTVISPLTTVYSGLLEGDYSPKNLEDKEQFIRRWLGLDEAMRLDSDYLALNTPDAAEIAESARFIAGLLSDDLGAVNFDTAWEQLSLSSASIRLAKLIKQGDQFDVSKLSIIGDGPIDSRVVVYDGIQIGHFERSGAEIILYMDVPLLGDIGTARITMPSSLLSTETDGIYLGTLCEYSFADFEPAPITSTGTISTKTSPGFIPTTTNVQANGIYISEYYFSGTVMNSGSITATTTESGGLLVTSSDRFSICPGSEITVNMIIKPGWDGYPLYFGVEPPFINYWEQTSGGEIVLEDADKISAHFVAPELSSPDATDTYTFILKSYSGSVLMLELDVTVNVTEEF